MSPPMNNRTMRPTRPRPRVPGAPVVVSAFESMPVEWLPPVSDGGSPIIAYRLYVNGSLVEIIAAPSASSADAFSPGDLVEVSAVNQVGEGPKSLPVVVA